MKKFIRIMLLVGMLVGFQHSALADSIAGTYGIVIPTPFGDLTPVFVLDEDANGTITNDDIVTPLTNTAVKGNSAFVSGPLFTPMGELEVDFELVIGADDAISGTVMGTPAGDIEFEGSRHK